MTLSPRMRAAFAEALSYDFRWHRERPMIDERALDVAVRRFPKLLARCSRLSNGALLAPMPDEIERYRLQIIAEYRYVLREGAA